MKTFLLLTLAVTVQQAIASVVSFSDCGSSDDILTLKEISFEPEDIHLGDDVYIYASGYLSKDIAEGSKVQVDINYFEITIYSQTLDYCDFVNNRNDTDYDMKCPIDEGDIEVAQKVTIPKDIPKGSYSMHITAISETGEPVGCADLKVDLQE